MKTYWELATDMSKTDLRELENRLVVIVEHLLKLGYVTGRIGTDGFRGWHQTVRYQRRDLARHIEQNAGLKSKLTKELIDKAYKAAAGTVKKEYPETHFPTACELSLEEIVGPDILLALGR